MFNLDSHMWTDIKSIAGFVAAIEGKQRHVDGKKYTYLTYSNFLLCYQVTSAFIYIGYNVIPARPEGLVSARAYVHLPHFSKDNRKILGN